ncbi:MAG: lipid-A-disaccharide synthase [Opitutales bacterium]|nr:lipid-A-disaccharide synthase [Opitutales bacterium]
MSRHNQMELVFSLPAPQKGPVDVLIIAGEHSGDEQAARMLRSFLDTNVGTNVAALGGPELKKAGADMIFDMMPYAVIGFAEALKRYSEFKALRDAIVKWIIEYKPKVVCFVDYPGLNLRIAEVLHAKKLTSKSGGAIRLVYYISPQVWVWKAGRRFKMARFLDGLGVIFPFEVDSFSDTDLDTKFVGHPFLGKDYELPIIYDPEGEVLLLPGSREGPISRIAPVMFSALELLLERKAELKVKCIYSSDTNRELLSELLEERPALAGRVELVSNSERTRARCVLTSSGTMSLNCALAGVPGAIVYRVHPLTFLLGKMLVRVPYIGMANILLERSLYPEYVQGAAHPNALQEELLNCLENPERLSKAQEGSQTLRKILDQPGGGAGNWLQSFVEDA